MLFKYIKKNNINVIYTLHDCWAFTSYCYYFENIKCYKWKSQCFSCPMMKKYLTLKRFDVSKFLYIRKRNIITSINNLHIITVSKWLQKTAKESFLSKFNIDLIYNGIDTETFRPVKNTIKREYNIENKFLILGVANYWDSRKGLKDFIEISKRLSDEYIIILVGLNKKQIESLPHNIIGITRTNSKEKLIELYSAADVFINTSTEETFGLVTAEAMACGTPAIVYDSTACPEIVSNDTGYIVPPHDINIIHEIIGKIRNEGNLYIENCIKRIHTNFSVNIMTSLYIHKYEDILRKGE